MGTGSRLLPLVLSWSGAFLSGCAAFTASRLAFAETFFRQDTLLGIHRAIALQQYSVNAEYELRLAEVNPLQARSALERATWSNPRCASAWIALGLLDDASRDWAAAEQELNRAAEANRQYLPAWTLANFYFRRGNRESFWSWADRAASLSYDDFGPLARLCDQFEPDPDRMLRHLVGARRLRPAYLNFLIAEDRLDDAQKVARMMKDDRANDPFLIDLSDHQLQRGHAQAAIELWNAASGFSPIEPSASKILTNGNLGRAPLNLGFDWRLGEIDGIADRWQPSELIFTFSGTEPEVCGLLEQIVYLPPRRFRLRFDYLSSDASIEGIHWALDSSEGPGIKPDVEWKEGAFDLSPTHGVRHLRLIYRREPGTERIEGRFELRNLRLEASS